MVLDTMEIFWPLEISWTLWKVSEHSGKLSGHSGKFTDTMECFRNLLKVFGQSGKFPESLDFLKENFARIFLVYYNQSQKNLASI